MRCLPVALCFALVFAAVPSTSQADPAAQARFFDELAREHYQARRYREALGAFFEEQRLAPNPRIDFNIALCFERLGDPAHAYSFYEAYLASEDEDAQRRGYAEKAKAKLARKVARVRVRTEPPGADIFVDEREYGSYGRSPREIVVSPGTHEIFLELSGHRPAKASVTVGRGKGAPLDAKLEPLQGILSITASPEASIQVRTEDGRTVRDGTSPLQVRLPAGVYAVAASAPERTSAETLLRVRADETTTHAFTLLAAERPKGEIVFTSNMTGAVVEVDGQPIGFAPVVGELEAGSHELRITHPERQPYLADVDVRAGQRAWLTAQLEPPPRTERSSLTWVSGGLGLAFAAAGGVVGLMANKRHDDFETAYAAGAENALEIRSDGQALNTTADALLITGAVGIVTSVVLYFVTEEEISTPSSGSVSWEAP